MDTGLKEKSSIKSLRIIVESNLALQWSALNNWAEDKEKCL